MRKKYIVIESDGEDNVYQFSNDEKITKYKPSKHKAVRVIGRLGVEVADKKKGETELTFKE